MDRRKFMTTTAVLAAGAAFPGAGVAAGQAPVLPQPRMSGGKPLQDALKARRSERSFRPDPLPAQVLSDLLWATCGVNRPGGRRTAPSCKNWQEIDVYAATAEGLFLYDAKEHALSRVLDRDIRARTGTQGFVANAPLNLVFVADFARMGKEVERERQFIAGADTGYLSQNVYLFCASEGLATVVRLSLDKEALAREMGLRPDQWITLAQTVGYPER